VQTIGASLAKDEHIQATLDEWGLEGWKRSMYYA
jgi:hypothetical protein